MAVLPRPAVRVLVVDDDEDTRELLRLVLVDAGSRVSTAASAREALARLRAEPVDVVLTDLSMPGEDGVWLARQIRALPAGAARRPPVVAVTAHGTRYDRQRMLGLGFDEYLLKPIDLEGLPRVIERVAAGR